MTGIPKDKFGGLLVRKATLPVSGSEELGKMFCFVMFFFFYLTLNSEENKRKCLYYAQ